MCIHDVYFYSVLDSLRFIYYNESFRGSILARLHSSLSACVSAAIVSAVDVETADSCSAADTVAVEAVAVVVVLEESFGGSGF